VLKVSDKSLWKSHVDYGNASARELSANVALTGSHPDLVKNLTVGVNGDWNLLKRKWSKLDLGARWDHGNSYWLFVQNIDVDTKKPGVLQLQWWHGADANTELGLLGTTDRNANKTTLE